METQSALNMNEINNLANKFIDNYVASIQAIKLDSRNGLIKRSDKIRDLVEMVPILQSTYERINAVINSERKIVEDELKKEEEQLDLIKKALNKSAMPLLAIIPAKVKNNKIPEKTSWADMVPDVVSKMSKENNEKHEKLATLANTSAKKPANFDI